jgi:hypothetical protein
MRMGLGGCIVVHPFVVVVATNAAVVAVVAKSILTRRVGGRASNGVGLLIG